MVPVSVEENLKDNLNIEILKLNDKLKHYKFINSGKLNIPISDKFEDVAA